MMKKASAEMNMNYKLIGCDLDGTLFDSRGRFSDENKRAIDELCALGVHFVPSSGRTLSDIPEEVRNHPSVRYIIHSSGAVVYDKQTGDRISFCMPKELSQSVLGLLFSFETHVSVRRLGATYVDKTQMSDEKLSYYKVWQVHADLLLDYACQIDDFQKTALSYDNVEMLAVFFKNDSERRQVQEILSQNEKLNVVSVCKNNLEIIYSEADKGRALTALCEKLSIKRNESIAVGDSDNDIPMLKAAGLGLAMKNASDTVKASSDEVICHCDEHAVKFIKEKYILN